ncbi:MAG TPA: hypothetical protein VGR95_12105 [Thermoanaerobaculia bacterium]|jgi:hypothetical protein|nr:hypothetical protein [Thermoanaerobaculia bacterium]
MNTLLFLATVILSSNTAPSSVIANRPDLQKLKVTEVERQRLIAALEQNHFGQEGAPLRLADLPREPRPNSDEEWSWRNRAKAHEEAIRQAKENRDLLRQKAEALRSHISGLLALGYKPHQFSYDATELAATLDQIPYAELSVTRAERAYDEFREEARVKGITPGWLR